MICKRTSTIVSGCQQHWFMKHFVIFSFLYFTYFLKFLLFVESSWRALSFIYAAYISNIVISKHWRKLTTICIVVVMAVLTSYQPLVVEPSILSKESSILLVVNTKFCLTHTFRSYSFVSWQIALGRFIPFLVCPRILFTSLSIDTWKKRVPLWFEFQVFYPVHKHIQRENFAHIAP